MKLNETRLYTGTFEIAKTYNCFMLIFAGTCRKPLQSLRLAKAARGKH